MATLLVSVGDINGHSVLVSVYEILMATLY